MSHPTLDISMGEPEDKKLIYKPDAPIKARLAGLAPLTVAKLAQARIKTLADMKRLTDEDLKKLPLALVEYAAVKRFVATIVFEGEANGGAENSGESTIETAVDDEKNK